MPGELVRARGHPNVLCLHRSTLEFTCEGNLTERGDCIFAVSSGKAMADLSPEFRDSLRGEDAVLEIAIECGGLTEKVTAQGHPGLTLDHPTDFVIRKSPYVCSRTLAVHADKAACDLGRDLVAELVKGGEVLIRLEVK
ncbi:MAG: DUF371 domain-containing protein [Candidatus Altiarchaeales archaeon]|nr:DUF371 domain-containing protein [Candidatus Altiarchaeales archaeon]MBD3416495.1 DUF371 domain-containing protein [Candidatus Altiarchaeales archaeon]